MRAETVEELCLKQHNCVIIIMNCPRGLNLKEREIGNTCSQPLEIGIFFMSLIKSHNNWPYLYRNREENDYGTSQKVRISR